MEVYSYVMKLQGERLYFVKKKFNMFIIWHYFTCFDDIDMIIDLIYCVCVSHRWDGVFGQPF